MKKIFNIYKLLVICNIFDCFMWMAQENTWLYVIDFLISLYMVIIIVYVKSKLQITLLIIGEILWVFLNPIVVYDRYNSIGASILSVILGIVTIIFLYCLKEDYDYL